MRDFWFSELWGPFDCEVKGEKCKTTAWMITLTDEENAKLPEQTGPDAASFILREKLGIAVCDKCQSPKGAR